jgi:hypothetical protein
MFVHLFFCLYVLLVFGYNVLGGVSSRLVLSRLLVVGRLWCHE